LVTYGETRRTAATQSRKASNGAALAAFLAAGFGCFAIGAVVILSELGIFVPPTLYEPAGGVSGRTTLGVVIWLVAWVILHFAWRNREVNPGPVYVSTVILILLGLIATFPPFWGVISG
jgi:multisubunit Na+/H+ antiporter MnhG subunit